MEWNCTVHFFHWSILSFLATLCNSLADRYSEQYCSVYLYNVQFHAIRRNALMLSHPSIDLFVLFACSHIFSLPLSVVPSPLRCILPPTRTVTSLFFSTFCLTLPYYTFFLSRFIRFAILYVGCFVRSKFSREVGV